MVEVGSELLVGAAVRAVKMLGVAGGESEGSLAAAPSFPHLHTISPHQRFVRNEPIVDQLLYRPKRDGPDWIPIGTTVHQLAVHAGGGLGQCKDLLAIAPAKRALPLVGRGRARRRQRPTDGRTRQSTRRAGRTRPACPP